MNCLQMLPVHSWAEWTGSNLFYQETYQSYDALLKYIGQI